MINIYVKPGEVIRLGREGTGGVRRVIYDFTRWVDLYGPGRVQLIAQRPGDTEPYPVALTIEGEKAIWEISKADTAFPGSGECEFQYFAGDGNEKSETFDTYTENAMGEPSETPPEPQQDWVNKVLDAANRAEAAADRAEAAGGESGFPYKIGHGLKVVDDTLTVDAANSFEGDNTLPATAALVQSTVGNIEILLGTI